MVFTEEEKNNIKSEITKILSDSKARDALEIIKSLGYSNELDSEIMNIIQEMSDEMDLYMTKKKKYLNFSDSDFAKNCYKGIYLATKESYGFVRVNGLDEDIFINSKNINDAIDGDLVLVLIVKRKTDNSKAEGRIIKILKRDKSYKLGEVIIKNGNYYSIIKDNKNDIVVKLEGNDIDRLVDGDIVKLELLTNELKALYKERVCHKNDPDKEIIVVLAEHDFETEFPEECLEQLKTIPTEVSENDIEGRLDLRNEMIFTIDGDDTKDIDDAISVKKLSNGNYELGVHIANVPYYIKENSPLDIEARNRGTSVYLADRVVPMYPHQISNGICSLNPGVDRLTISSIMEIDQNGKVIDYRIVESVINSKIQMTYNNVNKVIEEGIIPEGYEPYKDSLLLMKELANLVRKNKVNRGYIDFDIDEAKILIDSDGNVIDIQKRNRGAGEKLIEDFMILANESVAKTITDLGLMGVYRIHGDVSIDRLRKFLKILKNYRINIKDDFKYVNQKNIQMILEKIKVLDGFQVLANYMVSCMDKARYSTNNIGHFALASRDYTHFTSPIRRYPDTTIHRLLHDYLFSDLKEEVVRHWENILEDICIHSSEREKAAEDAEREVDKMKMAEFMESHLGEIHEGVISGMTSYGMYVTLPNLVEGMIRLNGNILYDQEREIMISKINNQTYTLGNKVCIKVIGASRDTRQIDFCLYDKDKDEVIGYVEEKRQKIKKKH